MSTFQVISILKMSCTQKQLKWGLFGIFTIFPKIFRVKNFQKIRFQTFKVRFFPLQTFKVYSSVQHSYFMSKPSPNPAIAFKSQLRITIIVFNPDFIIMAGPLTRL